MALFFHENDNFSDGARKKGFARYREVLERDFLHLILLNIITLISMFPLIFGISYALLSSSLLVMIPVCVLGGALAGPFISGLIDAALRGMRDASSQYMKSYWKAVRQNAVDAILAGAITFIFIGLYAFLAMFWWSVGFPSFIIIAITILSIVIISMILIIYWIQLVLFHQTMRQRLINSFMFIVKYFWRMIISTILTLAYWAVYILFIPYTLFVLPILGLWFISFLTTFILYNSVNEAFSLEEKLTESFPDQVPVYETDEEWLKRKAEEALKNDSQ